MLLQLFRKQNKTKQQQQQQQQRQQLYRQLVATLVPRTSVTSIQRYMKYIIPMIMCIKVLNQNKI